MCSFLWQAGLNENRKTGKSLHNYWEIVNLERSCGLFRLGEGFAPENGLALTRVDSLRGRAALGSGAWLWS